MNKEAVNIDVAGDVKAMTRPVLLTVLCLFAFVYFAMLSMLFFTCIFYSGTITRVRNLYVPENAYSHNHLLVLFSSGFLFNLLAFGGALFIWSGKRTGFWLLAPSCLIISAWQALQPQISTGTTMVNIFLLLLFGLFFRKLN